MKHITKGEYRRRSVGRFFDCRERYLEDVVPKELYDAQDGLCAMCQRPLESDYQLDHIVAIQDGGVHHRLNLQALHPKCHQRKHHAVGRELKRLARIEAKVIARRNLDWLEMALSA